MVIPPGAWELAPLIPVVGILVYGFVHALRSPVFSAVAERSDPLWRFADAPMHRACFLVWGRRKSFIARYDRLAQRMLAPDGSHPLMTGEGEIVWRASGSQPPGGPAV